MFQSTLLHEERHFDGGLRVTTKGFQSTLLHEERPTEIYKTKDDNPVSIHAPTRGATLK